MAQTALVIGGTGPTGPHIIRGLQVRGFEITILHRGTHELPELDRFEHIHADPHFQEGLVDALGARRFDLVVATYGRLREVAASLAGKCDRFIAVGGAPVYPGYHDPTHVVPRGMPLAATEEMADVGIADDGGLAGARVSGKGWSRIRPNLAQESKGDRFSRLIYEAEQDVLGLHAQGAFAATLFRYPSIYGPRQLFPREWSIVKRVLDRRPFIIMPDAGLSINTRCSATNAAAFLLAAVDEPEAAAGEVFNAADSQQFTLRQWAEIIAGAAGAGDSLPEFVSLPFDLAGPGRGMFPLPQTDHVLTSIHKARTLLGYREPVPAAEALIDTVRWYVENPPGPETMAKLTDTFDYLEEDRVVGEYREATASLRASQKTTAEVAHPYAHPKKPGETDHRSR